MLDAPHASKLGENRAIFASEEYNRLEKFRPYGIPTDEWLRSFGVRVFDLDSSECASLLGEYIRKNPEVWTEDIGEE